jgi:hypothetical protein
MLLCAVGLPGLVALSAVAMQAAVVVAASVPWVGLVAMPTCAWAVGLSGQVALSVVLRGTGLVATSTP